MLEIIVVAVVAAVVPSLALYSLLKKQLKSSPLAVPTETAKPTPPQPEIINAQASAKEIILKAENESLKIKKSAEAEMAAARREVFELEKRLSHREGQLNTRFESLERKESTLQSQQRGLSKKHTQLDRLRQGVQSELEQVARLTRDQAREQVLSSVEKELEAEVAKKIREAEEEYKRVADDKAREILVDAMRKGSHDYISETTTSKVDLPSEEMKGRIIGKEGRNIKAFERATGVDVDIDETPNSIQLSSFDPMRREVARLAMERLIADGRIQPVRIEEFVAKARGDVDRVVAKAGEDLCHRIKVYRLPEKIVNTLGRFKFRTSYGQNLVDHTLEVAKIGVALAQEVGADVQTVRLACLLHDVGKVLLDEEGTHVELGVDLLKRYKLPKEVINAVAEHHEDQPFSSIESVLVYLADAISGARPGARFEDSDSYLQRVRALEDAATSFPEVGEAYAVSAGREVRVIVKPEGITDNKVPILSRAIADKIEREQTYPGQVKVTVIRELRSSEIAR